MAAAICQRLPEWQLSSLSTSITRSKQRSEFARLGGTSRASSSAGGIHMSDNFAELVFIPSMAAIITIVMVGVGLLLARHEAKQSSATSQANDLVEQSLRKAS
jgi:hypothetical protein